MSLLLTENKMKNKIPSRRIAVLIDGGFFIKRFNALYNKDKSMPVDAFANTMYTMGMLM